MARSCISGRQEGEQPYKATTAISFINEVAPKGISETLDIQ
jgi:hypothetical protein